MRLLELTQRYPPALGGVESHVERLALELARAGVDVRVSTSDLLREEPLARLDPSTPRATPSLRRHRAFRLLPLPGEVGLVTPGMLRDLWAPSGWDAIHAHAFGRFPVWLAALARRSPRPPLVVTCHSDEGRGTTAGRWYARVFAHLALGRADRVVALTRHEADYLGGLGVPRDLLTVLPNGVDLEEFRDLPERDWSADTRTVLFVGRLSLPQKGIPTLLRAVGKIAGTVRLELRIVGEDGGGRAPLQRLASELGINSRVVFTGPLTRSDLLAEYARAHLFVLPSEFEPFGIVLLEAMAAGLPVVATRVGGIPEVVAEGRTADLVPPRDVSGLASALERQLREVPRSIAFGAAGRERAQGFSWAHLAPRYLRLFEEVTAGS